METWDIEEFEYLCTQAGNDGIKYFESLNRKFRAARDYHRINILRILNEKPFFNLDPESLIHGLISLEETGFEMQCEVDAFMNTLNSVFEFSAQLINTCLCKTKHELADVSFYKPAEWQDISEDIRNVFSITAQSELYKAIRNYCNVSKHHFDINCDYCLEIVNFDIPAGKCDTLPSSLTEPYNYRSKEYPPLEITEQKLKEYLEFVRDFMLNIGPLINRDLKSFPKR